MTSVCRERRTLGQEGAMSPCSCLNQNSDSKHPIPHCAEKKTDPILASRVEQKVENKLCTD
jgi:hypothetical protein